MKYLIPIFILTAVISCQTPTPEIQESEPLDVTNLTTNKSLVNTTSSPFAKLQPVPFTDVQLNDGFWKERVDVALSKMLPEMWSIYGDSAVSHALENFKIAAGKKPGKHAGAPFHDGDFYKLMEASSMAYAISGDEKFNQMIDEVIPLIKASQRADGYIHTPVMIQTRNNPETAVEFRDRMDFESYNMGHLMTAATVHYKATGKTDLMELAKKAADYLYTYTERFPEKMALNAICPSHYMGVVEMYRTTGDQRYLDLAKKFIDIRGLVENGTDHNQDRIPFREQEKAVGHAVRANYLYAGVTDVYSETGDETLKAALDKIWDDLVTTKLYITGGCGALYDGVSPNGTSYNPAEIQQVHQAYGREFQLPNAGAHNETCANIGNVLWNYRMFQTTAETKYAGMVENTLYNSVLSGANLNDPGYFYTNPLSHQMDLPFNMRWPNVRDPYISYSNCCPPNTIRTIMEVPNYLYSKTENGLWFNMYASSSINTEIGEEEIALTQTTNYPWDGTIKIKIDKAPDSKISLNFRIPEWCDKARIILNGKPLVMPQINGYQTLIRNFKIGEEIILKLDMPAKLIEANPLVESTQNMVAVKRGPLVYCVEGVDLEEGQQVSDVLLPIDTELRTETMEIAGFEVTALQGKAKIIQRSKSNQLYREASKGMRDINLTLIPHFAWANREEADMAIWLPVSR